MKKRVPALVLALALALTVPAWAAQDTPDNFVRSKTYAGQFSDLTPESTFYDNVAALYAYGLSVGKADGTFGLRDQLTVGRFCSIKSSQPLMLVPHFFQSHPLIEY